MVFNALGGRERWEGIVVCAWIVLIDLLLLLWIVQRPIDWLKFLLILLVVISIPLFIHIAYRAWIVASLEYWVDRNAVTIRWAGLQHVLPLPKIVQIYENDNNAPSSSNRLQWPAHYFQEIGRTSVKIEGKPVSMLSSQPLSNCLLLDLGDVMYAISPEDSQAFVALIQERYELGPAVDVSYERVPTNCVQRVLNQLTHQDSIGVGLLSAGAIGLLLLFGLLMVRFPNLPNDIVMRYTEAAGQDGIVRVPAVIRSKSTLFLLPSIALLTWLFNGLCGIWMALRDQRVGAYLLWGGTIIVQVFSFFALVGLM